MYAVIKTGGKQYRVQAGDIIVVEKLLGEPGAHVAFDEVLMIGEGEAVTLGAPLVDGASVSATLIETRKGEKIKVFKKIRRQGYRRTLGHRQFETVLRVTGIAGDGKSEDWAGEVDLTPRSERRLRDRNLARTVDAATARADAHAAFEHDDDFADVKPAKAKPAAKKVTAKPAKAQAKAAKPAKAPKVEAKAAKPTKAKPAKAEAKKAPAKKAKPTGKA